MKSAGVCYPTTDEWDGGVKGQTCKTAGRFAGGRPALIRESNPGRPDHAFLCGLVYVISAFAVTSVSPFYATKVLVQLLCKNVSSRQLERNLILI